MNILFLVHRFHPDIGGLEVAAEILASEFVKAGHTVKLATWSHDGTVSKHFSFNVIRNPSTFQLLKLFYYCDVVFENNPCTRLSWLNVFFQKPHLVVLQTFIARSDGNLSITDRFKKFRLRFVDQVVAVSRCLASETFPSATVIGNPFRGDVFSSSNSVLRSNSFVFVGRLVSDKGVGMAIEALILVREHLNERGCSASNITLTIIGDGPEKHRLQQQVLKAGLSDVVSFTGNLYDHEIAVVLQRSRFMLVPSIWKEPFGIVALEGLASGCIPIVSDGGGLPDVVGPAGLVFKRGDILDLVSSMLSVLNDVQMETRLRSLAVKQLEKYQPVRIARQYLDLIESAHSNKDINFRYVQD